VNDAVQSVIIAGFGRRKKGGGGERGKKRRKGKTDDAPKPWGANARLNLDFQVFYVPAQRKKGGGESPAAVPELASPTRGVHYVFKETGGKKKGGR